VSLAIGDLYDHTHVHSFLWLKLYYTFQLIKVYVKESRISFARISQSLRSRDTVTTSKIRSA
jgi:hypothetical protein